MKGYKQIFKDENILYCTSIDASDLKIAKRYLIEKLDFSPLRVIIMLVPYRFGSLWAVRNVSLYAVPRDYHIYFKEMFGRVIPKLKEIYPSSSFAGFTDHSPIDEVNAAAAAGLGIIGDNGLLINERYGSYVFIGEIFTDAPIEAFSTGEPIMCPSCGKCMESCPTKRKDTGMCLSELTQKKGDLTFETKYLMKKYNTAWGCDICQAVCPLNENSVQTEVAFFREQLKFCVSCHDDISDRAYNWRGRETIIRNLNILDGENIQ